MDSGANIKKKESSGTRETQREQTRARILQAVLDIAVEEGMRAVRHRAVAKRAGVSLGSTTYHFSSIEDLVTSAFHYWRMQKKVVVNPYYNEVKKRLETMEEGMVPSGRREETAVWICDQSVAYILDQLDGKRFDRLVELAFYHESIRYPSLRVLLEDVRQFWLGFLTDVHRAMGSPCPIEDAQITLALCRQLEKTAVMSVSTKLETEMIRRTITRHLALCFGLAPEAAAARSR